MSAYAMMFLGMTPFGALLAGVLSHPFGAPATVAIGGVACVAAAAVFAWRLPGLRPLARQLLETQQGSAGGGAQSRSEMRAVDEGGRRPIS